MSETEEKTASETQEPEIDQDGAPETTEEGAEDVDILKEVSLLGQHLGEALKEVWGSEERQKIEREFVKGVQVASTEVRGFADDVKSGKATQEIKEGAEKVGQDIRTGVLSGLRLFNRELRKMQKTKKTPSEEE